MGAVDAFLLTAVNDVLARLGITALAERQLPELSGGQREVVSIAQSLVTRPRVVLMDEPTSALDLCLQYEVSEALQSYAAESGAVMILAWHDLNQVNTECSVIILPHNDLKLAEIAVERFLRVPVSCPQFAVKSANYSS